jgi:hypothetical protein
MLQTGGLLRDLTVRELVSMMAALYPRPLGIDEVLDLTGLQGAAAQRTEKLSGGQAQRVRFACALVSNPDLLVLDEPTVAMDVEGRHAFWATMREFASRGTTIVFATHYLEEADDFADRAVLMAHGLVVADGPTTEIKARVGSRTIRATLPDVPDGALLALAGVAMVQRRGSLGFPLALYFLTAGPNQHESDLQGTGLSAPLYFMVSMASWGTMTAMLGTGARIAGERQVGWNRQPRISPLPARAYLRAKVAISHLMAMLSIILLYLSGVILGVRLPASEWLQMTGLILVGLVPFAALGIFLGHKLTVDAIGPFIGGGTALLALLSGTWFPLSQTGFCTTWRSACPPIGSHRPIA